MFSVDLPPDSSWKWETKDYEDDGHNQPCYYCGELCNNLIGDHSQWSVGFPEKDEPGKVKYHHMGCLLKRLDLLEEAKDLIYLLLGDNFSPFIREVTNNWLENYGKINKKDN